MSRPDLSKVPEWYHRYINLVKEENLEEAFNLQSNNFEAFLDEIPATKRLFRYGPDKWTIQEVIQHIIDAERVFAYRALCIARKETASLPSFDENDYAANSRADSRSWDDLLSEYKSLRKSNVSMFKSFNQEQLDTFGTVNGNRINVLAFGYIMVGHILHHVNIITERYL